MIITQRDDLHNILTFMHFFLDCLRKSGLGIRFHNSGNRERDFEMNGIRRLASAALVVTSSAAADGNETPVTVDVKLSDLYAAAQSITYEPQEKGLIINAELSDGITLPVRIGCTELNKGAVLSTLTSVAFKDIILKDKTRKDLEQFSDAQFEAMLSCSRLRPPGM